MKTETPNHLLAQDAGPAPRAVVARRLAPAAVASLLAALVLVIVFTPLVPAGLMREPGWWLKLGYAAALASAAAWCVARLARPGLRADRAAQVWVGIALLMAAIGLFEQLQLPPGTRLAAWLGHSWTTCPRNVMLLSLPAMALCFWALRGLAPTQPRRAGLAAGLLAGALGAMVYTLACSELSPSFVVTWYTLGIAGAGVIGALLGPRLLRW